MAISAVQERRLISNIRKWTRILDESAKSLSTNPNDILRKYKEYDFSNLTPDQFRQVRSSIFAGPAQAHMIAICLRQIDEYIRELKACPIWSGVIAEKGLAFRAIMKSQELRNLRDVVEHSAEYIAGRGRMPKLIQDPEQDWPDVLIIDGRINKITIFGCSYVVRHAISAAIEFVMALPSEKTGK